MTAPPAPLCLTCTDGDAEDEDDGSKPPPLLDEDEEDGEEPAAQQQHIFTAHSEVDLAALCPTLTEMTGGHGKHV